jgi:hypothetical protein
MDESTSAIGLTILAFAGLLVCLEIGYRLGVHAQRIHPDPENQGLGALGASVFGLLGLLLAFSFARATLHLDARRSQVTQEANAIGTAWMRLDLLSRPDQPEIRRLFRLYVQSRLASTKALEDPATAEREWTRAEQLQQEIWARAVPASQADPSGTAALLLLPALNDMIGITTSRTVAYRMRVPLLIVMLLLAVALLSGVIAGYGTARLGHRSWLHMVLYAGIVAATIYVVLDIENPTFGLVRLGAAEQAFRSLQDLMR